MLSLLALQPLSPGQPSPPDGREAEGGAGPVRVIRACQERAEDAPRLKPLYSEQRAVAAAYVTEGAVGRVQLAQGHAVTRGARAGAGA